MNFCVSEKKTHCIHINVHIAVKKGKRKKTNYSRFFSNLIIIAAVFFQTICSSLCASKLAYITCYLVFQNIFSSFSFDASFSSISKKNTTFSLFGSRGRNVKRPGQEKDRRFVFLETEPMIIWFKSAQALCAFS